MSRSTAQIAYLLSFSVAVGLGGCTADRAGEATDVVQVWDRWEHVFTASAEATPETELAVHFTSPSGLVRVVDGFWDGDDVWRVRFMPDEAGTWQFQTLAQPAAVGLHDQRGSFTAETQPEAENRFLRHGAIQVSENGRYFVHRDGTPFFWLGDTAWNGALMSTEDAWETFLADRAEKRFTGIQFVTTQWRAAEANLEGELAYTGSENVRINPSFFRRLDARIDAINRHGMLAAPVLLWALGTQEGNPGFLPVDQAVRLARYMVARYGAHHVIWFLGGDGDYGGEHVDRWRRIGRGVFNRPDHAPVTLHGRGQQWPFDPYVNEAWFTYVGYQSGHGDGEQTLRWIHSGPPGERWTDEPAMPIINLEPPYEDHLAYQSREPHSAYNVRRAVYWSMMNTPVAGVTYGVHGIWSWETEPRVPLNHENTGIARPWHEAMALPGSTHMRHMAELITSLPWWTLRPAQNLLVEQPGGDDPARFVSATRSDDGRVILVYLPVGGVAPLRGDMLPAQAAKWWFDPRDGTFSEASAEEGSTFTAPSEDDWVLAVVDASLEFPTVGAP